MKLIKLKCPNCGSSLEVDQDKKEFFCKYCRTTTLLDDEVIKVEHTIIDKNKEEGLKIFKSFGIVSFVFLGIIVVSVLGIIITVLFNIFKQDDIVDDKVNDTNDVQNNFNNNDIYSAVEIQQFNGVFELYNGTESGFFVGNLLDEIVATNKKQGEHIITLIYGEINTADYEEIIKIKGTLNDFSEYQVLLDYDQDGFVNKVTITELS